MRARALATLVVTGLCTAYIVWKIDLGETLRVLGDANLLWLFASFGIMALSVWPMAWRWQQLLAARGVREPLGWLVRTYFVGYAAGQVLPTSLGGDASRIFETVRRHPEARAAAAGTVLLERALGGITTLLLAAVGFVLALGRYDVGGYLWVELGFLVVAAVVCVFLFSRRVHDRLQPVLRMKVLQDVYVALHSFRDDAGLLASMLALTLVVQAVRVLAIWCAGKSVGIDLSPLPYYVMGPLLFLVMLVPFTINGLAVRESFFVSFLGTLGVAADPAFAAGFLFFLVTVALAFPGLAILARGAFRR